MIRNFSQQSRTAIFCTKAVLIERKAEQHNMDSIHHADYVNKMKTISGNLWDIKCNTNNEKSLENARKKLLTALDNVDKFIQHFGESGGKVEFKAEAMRRIRTAQELLTTRQTSAEGVAMPIGRRVLIKAQSSLQEIMNSAAAIAATQARENLQALDGLQKLLKKSRDIEVNQFNSMEEEMNELNIIDALSRIREDSEILHSDASSKLRDAIKRWTSIKNQAVPRKVAEYKEDLSEFSMATPMGGVVVPVNPDLNPQKIFQDTGNKFKTVGKLAATITKEAVGEVKSFAQNSANEVKTNAERAAKTVGKVFTGDEVGKPGGGTGNGNGAAQGKKQSSGLRLPGKGSDSESGTMSSKQKSSSGFPKLNLDL